MGKGREPDSSPFTLGGDEDGSSDGKKKLGKRRREEEEEEEEEGHVCVGLFSAAVRGKERNSWISGSV